MANTNNDHPYQLTRSSDDVNEQRLIIEDDIQDFNYSNNNNISNNFENNVHSNVDNNTNNNALLYQMEAEHEEANENREQEIPTIKRAGDTKVKLSRKHTSCKDDYDFNNDDKSDDDDSNNDSLKYQSLLNRDSSTLVATTPTQSHNNTNATDTHTYCGPLNSLAISIYDPAVVLDGFHIKKLLHDYESLRKERQRHTRICITRNQVSRKSIIGASNSFRQSEQSEVGTNILSLEESKEEKSWEAKDMVRFTRAMSAAKRAYNRRPKSAPFTINSYSNMSTATPNADLNVDQSIVGHIRKAPLLCYSNEKCMKWWQNNTKSPTVEDLQETFSTHRKPLSARCISSENRSVTKLLGLNIKPTTVSYVDSRRIHECSNLVNKNASISGQISDVKNQVAELYEIEYYENYLFTNNSDKEMYKSKHHENCFAKEPLPTGQLGDVNNLNDVMNEQVLKQEQEKVNSSIELLKEESRNNITDGNSSNKSIIMYSFMQPACEKNTDSCNSCIKDFGYIDTYEVTTFNENNTEVRLIH